MNKIEDTEISRQNVQRTEADANYLKLRLDCQRLHRNIYNFLGGTTDILKFDSKTNQYVETTESIGEPLASRQGIQSILTYVVAIVNEHTIQGNTEREELYKILFSIDESLCDQLILNYQNWKIDPSNRDLIVDTIMNMIHLILTRTVDNKERESLGGSIDKVTKYFSNENKSKGLKI